MKRRHIHVAWAIAVATITLNLLTIPCSGQDVCPWLNNPTASGVLGGSVTVSVTKMGDRTTTCSFLHQESSDKVSLQITVSMASTAVLSDKNPLFNKQACRVPVMPLRGIGNRAVLCASDRDNERTSTVTGQVRDRTFTVAITGGKKMALSNDERAKKAELVADQVAGSLF